MASRSPYSPTIPIVKARSPGLSRPLAQTQSGEPTWQSGESELMGVDVGA